MLFFGAIGAAPDFEAKFSPAVSADPDGAIFRNIPASTATYSLAARAFDRARHSMLLTFFPTHIDLDTQFITSAFDERGNTYNIVSASIVESTIEKRSLLGLVQAAYVAQGSISARSTFRPQTIEGMMALSELPKRGVQESPTIQFTASAICVSTFSETDEPRSALLLTNWDAEAVGCENDSCLPWLEIMAATSSGTTAATSADGQ